MRKLWLHIGSHKTGTTTLQGALSQASRNNELGQWRYIYEEKFMNMNNIVSFKNSGAAMRWLVDPDFLEQHIPETGDCIISSERLFWLDEKKQIRALAEKLQSKFDEINVIVYLRRQDKLALSFRKTTISIPFAKRFFGEQIKALPKYEPHMDKYFNYAEKIQMWSDVFGNKNVVVRKYEKECLFGGDTVSDFSFIIKQPIPCFDKIFNKSMSRNQLLVGMWLSSKKYPSGIIKSIIKNIKDEDKLLPSKSEAEAFVLNFEESNKKLAIQYGSKEESGYFDADFSFYPQTGNDLISDIPLDLQEIEVLAQERLQRRMRRQRRIKKQYETNTVGYQNLIQNHLHKILKRVKKIALRYK